MEVPAAALSCSPPAQLLVLLSCLLPSVNTLRCSGPAFASGSPQWLLLLPLLVTCLLTLSLLSLLPKEAEAAGTEAGTGLAVGNGSLTRWVGRPATLSGMEGYLGCLCDGLYFHIKKTTHHDFGCLCIHSLIYIFMYECVCKYLWDYKVLTLHEACFAHQNI